MSTPLKIVVIAGGLTHERDVSLRSGARVATLLRRSGHDVTVADVDNQLLSTLRDAAPDVVFPLVHGSIGEDGSLQDLLEVAGISFVGSQAQACRLASSKPVAKSVVAKNALSTPDFVALPQDLFRQLGSVEVLDLVARHLGFPVMVKPAGGGSALGVTKVSDSAQLRSAMVDALAYGEQVQIERFVSGTEVSISIVEDCDGKPVVLPPVEIVPASGNYDFDARYNAGRSEFFVPARLNEQQVAVCNKLALDCHRVLELSGYSRIDMILDQAGTPWFIDANVAPGFTETSLLPLAAEQLSFDGLQEICASEANDFDESDKESALQVILSHLCHQAAAK